MPYFEAGETVTVYEYPHTGELPEGDAVLVSYIRDGRAHEGRPLEWWRVRFVTEAETYERLVKHPTACLLPPTDNLEAGNSGDCPNCGTYH